MGRLARTSEGWRSPVGDDDTRGWNAGVALALVYPLIGRKGTYLMKRKPSIKSLESISLDEAVSYLDYASGDELRAAHALAWDRNRLDGSRAAPDEEEIHHALFLLCRARGRLAPSFDEMRIELRRRAAA